jgi:hypothetical protein
MRGFELRNHERCESLTKPSSGYYPGRSANKGRANNISRSASIARFNSSRRSGRIVRGFSGHNRNRSNGSSTTRNGATEQSAEHSAPTAAGSKPAESL